MGNTELVGISPELKKQLDEMKHEVNFSKMAEFRAKRVLAYGDILQITVDHFIKTGGIKELTEVPDENKRTDSASSN